MKKLKETIHYFLIPSERNNYRAKAIQHDFLTFYLLLAFLLLFATKHNSQFRNVLGYATDVSVQRLYELTNEQRLKNNLPSFTYSEGLAQAAQQKAQDMFTKNYWAHYGPTGTPPWSFILAAGYNYEYAGENLAKNFLFSQNVVDGWMASATHRENILRQEFSEVGLAVVNGTLNGEETTLVVQMFGKPAQLAQIQQPPPQENSQQPTTEQPQVAQSQTVQEGVVPQVLVQNKKAPATLVASAPLSFDIAYVFIAFLLTILTFDLYFASKLKVIRVHGKTMFHLIFLFVTLAGVLLYLTKGAIL